LRFIAVALIAVQTAFLFFAGVGIASYSTPFFQATPAIAKLQSVVGDSLVGLNGGNVSNVRSFRGVGLYPNVNIGYSIRIFGVHDPLLPAAYFASWPIQSAAPSKRGVGLFVPDINSVALAERYGIAYVLTKAGVAPPTGMRSIAVIAGETLSRVPGAAQFSFVSGDADHVSSVTTNGDGAWSITTSGDTAGELALRVTAEPGFKATIDGKPLALRPYDAVMMQARIPAGHHQIDLKYEPTRLLVGLAVALATLISLVAFAALFRFGLRRRRPLRPR
jgi:hypothetical protein